MNNYVNIIDSCCLCDLYCELESELYVKCRVIKQRNVKIGECHIEPHHNIHHEHCV